MKLQMLIFCWIPWIVAVTYYLLSIPDAVYLSAISYFVAGPFLTGAGISIAFFEGYDAGANSATRKEET